MPRVDLERFFVGPVDVGGDECVGEDPVRDVGAPAGEEVVAVTAPFVWVEEGAEDDSCP